MTDRDWDLHLGIHTTGREDYAADTHHYAYEPTPYSVLDRLAASGYIEAGDVLVDYGCGKGRAALYLNFALGCRTIGIERDPALYLKAMANLESYAGRLYALSPDAASEPDKRAGSTGVSPDVYFFNTGAEDYEIDGANRFYFFNPFSETILRPVIRRIFDSYYSSPRGMKLFFYYPSPEYESVLASNDELEFFDDIRCGDLFPETEGDPREHILVYGIG